MNVIQGFDIMQAVIEHAFMHASPSAALRGVNVCDHTFSRSSSLQTVCLVQGGARLYGLMIERRHMAFCFEEL